MFSTFKEILPVFNRSEKVDGLGAAVCSTLVYSNWCISILIIIIIIIIIIVIIIIIIIIIIYYDYQMLFSRRYALLRPAIRQFDSGHLLCSVHFPYDVITCFNLLTRP